MRLAVNIGGFVARYGLEKSIELCKNAGFDSMDFGLGLDPANPLNVEETYVAEAERIKKLSLDMGLPVTQTHTPFHFKDAWKDPVAYEEYVMPAIKRSVAISGLLGADVAVVHPLHHFLYKGHEEEIFEKNMEFYRSLIPICKEYNVKVGIENMFQGDPRRKQTTFDTCATIPEFIRYVDTLDSEYMVACLDTGHIGLPVRDDECWDFIRALGHDRLQSLHVHDNDYRGDKHQLPYLGTIDWNEVTKALGEIDYQGDFTYEVRIGSVFSEFTDEEFVPIATKYMADVGRHLCNMIDRNRPTK